VILKIYNFMPSINIYFAHTPQEFRLSRSFPGVPEAYLTKNTQTAVLRGLDFDDFSQSTIIPLCASIDRWFIHYYNDITRKRNRKRREENSIDMWMVFIFNFSRHR